MSTEFPTISYGRRRDNTTGSDDFYDLIDKSPDFPADAETIFRDHLCKSVQWKGSSGETYPDCFLVWKIDETRILLARMMDAGNDSRHRPHSLRIDAELIDMTPIENPAAFLSERCTQAEPIDRTEYFHQFFENHWEHLFIATHPHIQYAGIIRRISEVSEESTATENKPVAVMPESVTPQTKQPASPLPPKRSLKLLIFSFFKIVLLTFLLFFPLFICYNIHYVLVQKLQDEMKILKQENQEKSDQLELITQVKAVADKEKTLLQKENTKLQEENTELQEELEKIKEPWKVVEEHLQELKNQIEELPNKFNAPPINPLRGK